MSRLLPCLLVPLAVAACAATTPARPTPATVAVTSAAGGASRTHWVLEPAQAYDAIAFVNLLTGDPFYVANYRADYERWAARLGPPEKQALAHLTHRIKEQEHGMIYPTLALAFSGVEPRTLADLRHSVADDGAW